MDDRLYLAVRDKVQRLLLAELSPTANTGDVQMLRLILERIFAEILAEERIPLSRGERSRTFDEIVADILGYGPIGSLLQDDSITEILVYGPDQVLVERKGILEVTSIRFRDYIDVFKVIDRIVIPKGVRLSEQQPMHVRLPDGSRLSVDPLSLVGPSFRLRKVPGRMLTVDDLVLLEALTADMIGFLRACVKARMNILVSGQLSTGKTTLLNALVGFLPENERIVSVDETVELQFKQDAVVRLESRPPNFEGRIEVCMWELVNNALSMRPDRLLDGRMGGGEIWSILEATNTVYDGLLAPAPSCTPHDALHRLERKVLIMMGDRDRFQRAKREQIALLFDLIVHLSLLVDGTRKVVQVVEVLGVEGEHIAMQDIFRYVHTGAGGGQVQGYFTATGVRPKFMDRIEAAGISVPAKIFSPARTGH